MDLEGPSPSNKQVKEPWTLITADGVCPRKEPKTKRGRRRERESAEVGEITPETADLGPRRTEIERKKARKTTDLCYIYIYRVHPIKEPKTKRGRRRKPKSADVLGNPKKVQGRRYRKTESEE